jgi:hypothetical protein
MFSFNEFRVGCVRTRIPQFLEIIYNWKYKTSNFDAEMNRFSVDWTPHAADVQVIYEMVEEENPTHLASASHVNPSIKWV